MEEYIQVEVDSQPIELCKLLKIANLVGGGGEAKIVISEGYVYVNGEVEFQKRKKIYHQDTVEFNGELVELLCFTPEKVKEKRVPAKQKQLNESKKQNETNKSKKSNKPSQNSKAPAQKTGGRKRINF